MNTPGMRAGGLARSMDGWQRWGYVDVPPSERDAFERWLELEKRSSSDYQAVVHRESGPGRRCDLLIAFRTCVSCQVGDFGAPG